MTEEQKERRLAVEREEQWDEWFKKIPFISFDPSWQVKINPPVGAVLTRFYIKKGSKTASVFLDVHNALTAGEDQPVWEVMTDDYEIMRFPFEDHQKMMDYVKENIN